MHPDDARARGLQDGVRVRVWNDLGEVRLPLRVTDAVPAGVVCSLKGAWMRDQRQRPDHLRAVPGHHADISRRRLLQRRARGGGGRDSAEEA